MEYQELDNLIEALRSAVEEDNPQKGYWSDLWALVRKTGEAFKGVRYASNNERERAWARFQELIEKARERSKANQSRIEENRRKWDARKKASQDAASTVVGKARNAHPLSDFERSIADLVLFVPKLIASVVLKLVGLEATSQLEEIRQELLGCNEALRKAWDAFRSQKDAMLPGDRNEAFAALKEAQDQLSQGWDHWKEMKARVREQRQRDWDERQRARQARQAEREERHKDFVTRVEANIEKLEAKLEKALDALDRQENHLSDLKDKLDSAWNDDFRERCSGWISEAEDRIESIKSSIERLEGWIEQERDKIR